MGKLKIEVPIYTECTRKQEKEIIECGEKRLEEARLNALSFGYEGISLIDEIKAIDDDDIATIAVAPKEVSDIVDPIQHIEIDPPPGHTMGEFYPESILSGELLVPIADEVLLFQDIADGCTERVSEPQAVEFASIIQDLESYF